MLRTYVRLERAWRVDVARHLAPLDRVDPERAAFDRRRRRLEPADADGHGDDGDEADADAMIFLVFLGGSRLMSTVTSRAERAGGEDLLTRGCSRKDHAARDHTC